MRDVSKLGFKTEISSRAVFRSILKEDVVLVTRWRCL